MPEQSPNEFVLASSVRTEIVTQLADGTAPIDELLTSVDASDSAVYNEVSALAERGLLTGDAERWELSAHGQLVADAIDWWHSTEAFLGTDPEYWKNHDASVIPPKFRRRLPHIGAYEVVRSSESQITKHHREALTRLREADHCLVFSSFFSTEYHNAIPDSPKTRLLVHQSAFETRAQRRRDGIDAGKELEHVELRVTESRCSYAVGEDFLVLRLPTQSGEPTRANVVSETASAVQWGRDLFEEKWAEAAPR